MPFQAMAIFLVSWLVPTKASEPRSDELPRWERHPLEQRALRDQAARETVLLSQITRAW